VNGKGDWYNRGGVGRDKKVAGSRSQGEEDETRIKRSRRARAGGKIMRRRDIIYPHLIRRGSWNRRAIGTHTFTSSPQPELVHTAKKR
jgi:hypothetical protein